MDRRTFFRGVLTTALVGASGTSIYACGLEPHAIKARTVRLSVGLTRPLRLVVLGDLHFDPLYEETYLEHAIFLVNGLNPDLIVYTGDFVSHDSSRIGDLMRILSRGSSRLGTFAVLGNHDYWSYPEVITAALQGSGIQVLVNESVPLPGQENFFLTGMDSFWAGDPDPAIFSKSPDNSRHLVVVHEPDSFDRLRDPRIKLQISGHTHGGQIRFPFVGAVHLPRWGRRYDAGLFTDGERKLYVNCGLGTIRPHIRFDCPPEITLLELS